MVRSGRAAGWRARVGAGWALAALSGGVLSGGAAVAQAPAPTHDVYLFGTLRVSDAWVEAGTGAAGASAYLTVENRGAAPEQLTGGSVDGGAAVPVAGGDAPAEALTVPPGGTLRLEPGGPHLQVAEPRAGAGPGRGSLPGTLRFARGGTLSLVFATHPPPAPEPAPASHRAIDLSR